MTFRLHLDSLFLGNSPKLAILFYTNSKRQPFLTSFQFEYHLLFFVFFFDYFINHFVNFPNIAP